MLIPTHNCEKFLEQTLLSVIEQDRGDQNMEIIVVDDCSELDPTALVRKVGKGRIQVIRQRENVGKSRNFQTGLEASRGRLIHQLHGDDFVQAGFYESMEDAFALHPSVGAFFCESEYVDDDGNIIGCTGKEAESKEVLSNWLDKLVIAQRIQTPSIAVRREVYETAGGFDFRLANFEDWEMWVRAALCFQFGFNPDATASYRIHSSNTSSQSVLDGTRWAMMRSAISIMDSYLPPDVVRRCKRARARSLAHQIIQTIPQILQSGNLAAWAKACGASMRFSLRPRELYYLLLFTIRYRRYSPTTNR